FSSRLIKLTHKELLKGVRGKHKQPGEFRASQNWIGGASINDATFVPPVHSSIGDYMSDLEKFAHNDEHYFPVLLKAALIHYQFKTIHPFLDGNGRVGRLMITLFLIERGILKQPILYLSDFFEQNRSLYYENLMKVREKGDITQWFKFFLVGIIETAKKGIDTFDGILKLQKDVQEKLSSLGSRKNNGEKVLHYLFERPMLDTQKVAEITGLSTPSAYKLVDELERIGMLVEFTGSKKGKKYMFKDYLDLFQE
ncbi:MAG: Fic family protein, partial [Cyclobacteriaceae bacterium]